MPTSFLRAGHIIFFIKIIEMCNFSKAEYIIAVPKVYFPSLKMRNIIRENEPLEPSCAGHIILPAFNCSI
jgi:hypothetical protein